MKDRKIVIIGGGPAGISASLYTARAGIHTMVIGRDGGALAKTDKIENYYGFPQPISGRELLEAGQQQARRLGVRLIAEEVLSIGYMDCFTVTTKEHTFEGDAVILATGASRSAPGIPGLERLEGRGVSYCSVCDAFFYRGKDVAVLGSGEYALHEARELLPVVGSVTLLTNGGNFSERETVLPKEIRVVEKKLGRLEGEDQLEAIVFEDGSQMSFAGLFVAVGVASSSDLARKIGAAVEGSRILVNELMETTVPGLFAAGDCTGGLLQVSKAVYEGAKAAVEAIRFVRQEERMLLLDWIRSEK